MTRKNIVNKIRIFTFVRKMTIILMSMLIATGLFSSAYLIGTDTYTAIKGLIGSVVMFGFSFALYYVWTIEIDLLIKELKKLEDNDD